MISPQQKTIPALHGLTQKVHERWQIQGQRFFYLRVCYCSGMNQKLTKLGSAFALSVVLWSGSGLCAAEKAHAADKAQAAKSSQPEAVSAPTASTATPAATVAAQAAGAALVKQDCFGPGCEPQPAHITIATEARPQAPWPVQDRILWGAQILMALAAYAGVVMAISLLRKIERQGRYSEAAAIAAADAAQAALEQSRSIARAERPWVLVSVEPSRTVENGFNVVACNRGKTPARLLALPNAARIAKDEAELPAEPELRDIKPLEEPVLLVPGESMVIRTFSRDEVKKVCSAEGSLQRVDTWEDRVYIYGRIDYEDLLQTAEAGLHQSHWCCWYVHGRQKSGLVVAGPQSYHRHS